jgi:exosortase A
MSAAWKGTLVSLAACIGLILALYWRTAESMVAIWYRSETFAHGFLIVPIVLVLVWMKRRELARLVPTPEFRGLALIAAAAAVWLVAVAGDAQVVQQFAMMAMIPLAVLTIAGARVAFALAFPLAFLLFAVPVGEALVPPLMDWTATFTVTALRLSGIPVLREGTFFVIPSGQWSVVEGCSGLRYLIASATVGTLYAYLTYSKTGKRALFAVLSILVPIVANGLRAYGIVMIAHLSDMKLALGIDHFIYGWVWFGVVMLLMFWAGSFWRDLPVAQAAATGASSPAPIRRSSLAAAAAAIAGVAAAGPLYAAWLERADARAQVSLPAPRDVAGWRRIERPLTDWRPHYSGAVASRFDVYEKDGRFVAVYLGFYRHQRRGAELVTTTNVMVVQKHPVWSNVGEASATEKVGEAAVSLRETRLRSATQRLLVWDWYWISGRQLSNPYLAKAYLAADKLLGAGDDAAAVILVTPYEDHPESARETLRQFAAAMQPSVQATLDLAKKEAG